MKLASCLALLVVSTAVGCGGSEATAARIAQIGELGDATQEEYDSILEHLENGDAQERAVSAWALGELGRASAVPALLQALERDGERDVRLNASTALGKFEGDEVRQGLVGALDDAEEQVRAAALRSLAQPGFSGAAAQVGELLDGGSDTLRPLALEALAAMGGPETRSALERAVADPDPALRGIAAFSLGKLRDPAAVPALGSLLDDESWEVRANAAQALGMIGDASARPLLEPLLEDEHEQVSTIARRALDKLD